MKIAHNEHLKKQIDTLQGDVDRMKGFFIKMQPSTDDMIEFLNGTYICEYMQEKHSVNRDVVYNENIIIEVVSCIQDYHKLIEDFEKGVIKYDENVDTIINRNLKDLNQTFKFKLESFKKENYMNNMFNTFKAESKTSTFDDIIKKMANDIVKNVNSQTINKDQHKEKKIKKIYLL
jgi:hypothetical protein